MGSRRRRGAASLMNKSTDGKGRNDSLLKENDVNKINASFDISKNAKNPYEGRKKVHFNNIPEVASVSSRSMRSRQRAERAIKKMDDSFHSEKSK